MRTTIEIDDALMKEARRVTSIKKKRELVETALHALIRRQKLAWLADNLHKMPTSLTQKDLRRMRGG